MRTMTDFEDHPTADEVLDGVDLTGRTALVTGGYSGIGPATVASLSRAGARVLVPARRPDEAREVLADVERVEVGEMDLSDQASVAAYAETLLDDGTHLDIVINSAGVMATPGDPHAARGGSCSSRPTTSATTRWSTGSGRCSTAVPAWSSVSSAGHHLGDIRWDDPWFTLGYDKWEAYGQSKTANALFAVHLDAARSRARRPGVLAAPGRDPHAARPAPARPRTSTR